MKDTVAKRTYRCKCGVSTEDHVWSSSIMEHTIKCTKCESVLSFDHIKVEKVVHITSIRTPTKNR